MKTARWKTPDNPSGYDGPGRVAISKVPAGVKRGYRRSPILFVENPSGLPVGMIDLSFAMADAGSVFRLLHTVCYPWEPIIMGRAPTGVESYRTEFARWLEWYCEGETISEISDPEAYRPVKVRPILYGLTGPALRAEPIVRIDKKSNMTYS